MAFILELGQEDAVIFMKFSVLNTLSFTIRTLTAGIKDKSTIHAFLNLIRHPVHMPVCAYVIYLYLMKIYATNDGYNVCTHVRIHACCWIFFI